MGDSNRHLEFARFIEKRFPKAERVLVVADGKGELGRKLANRGHSVHIVEAKPRFKGNLHPKITYEAGWFTEETPIEADLVVGMHPDEATSSIILAAKKQKKPWAVVPCCVVGPYSNGIGLYTRWLNKLGKLAESFYSFNLKISGKNTVLYYK